MKIEKSYQALGKKRAIADPVNPLRAKFLFDPPMSANTKYDEFRQVRMTEGVATDTAWKLREDNTL